SAAKPKIGDYPFTTLTPQLGVVKLPAGDGFVMADIPGLIEGASRGVGLGHQFLRHVERTRLLVHLIDITSDHIEKDLATINEELRLHSEKLARLPQIVVVNKMDLLLEDEAESKFADMKSHLKKKDHAQHKTIDLLMISAATTIGLEPLRNLIARTLSELK